MNRIIRQLTLLTIFFAVNLWANVPIVGVVLEENSNETISSVEISYNSGKRIDQTNRKGTFEIIVPREDIILVFSKAGYEKQSVDLSEYADLMDIVVVLSSNVRQLDQNVVRGVVKPTLKTNRDVPIDMLEDAAGMRFDMTELLVQLPGFSGQQDFSSEVSYNGSRSEDVNFYLGGMAIPNMRHLDIGFPGNLSVVNPHVLKSIRVHDNPAVGPIEQGLAAAVEYEPAPGDPETFNANITWGLVNRELRISSPFVIADGFVFSIRYMSPQVLENLGQKFFTEFNRDALCDDCEVKSKEGNFELSSGDVYTNFSGADKDGSSYNLTLLFAWDNYSINQDTSARADSIKSTAISAGEQKYYSAIYNYNAASGNRWHMGWIREDVGDTIRDTADFRNTSNAAFNNYLGDDYRINNTFSFGMDILTDAELLGSELSWATTYQFKDAKRYYTDKNASQEADKKGNLLQASIRMLWNSSKWNNGISVGGISALKTETAPTASIALERNITKAARIFTRSAYRQQYVVSPNNYGELKSELKSNATGDLGFGLEKNRFQVSTRAYGSYYFEPELPEPQAFWHYRSLDKAKSAWLGGANLNFQYRTLHHFVVATNISSVYGEYQLDNDKYMPWEANRLVDVNTSLRYYPLADSLISVILTYRASVGRPLYSHDLELSTQETDGSWKEGTRSINYYDETTNLYRTDLRLNLDLSSRWKRVLIDDLRFFLEVNNIFSGFDGEWAKYLGGDNARQRSWVSSDEDNNPDNIELVPWLAKGMGFFVQFGVEGSFKF